jgi:mRNA-degrading endonuclease RelE of RelBE toxin-antitoxin system
MSKAVIFTNQFKKAAKKILKAEHLKELADYLQANPEAGDLIQGTGGIRKLRWISPQNNKGKSGGLRIIYHYHDNIVIILITVYSKSDADNISEADKNNMKKYLPDIIKNAMEELE